LAQDLNPLSFYCIEHISARHHDTNFLEHFEYSMKNNITFLFAVLFLCVIYSFSQWSSDPNVNLTVCDTTNDQVLCKISPTTDGGCYVCWFDDRSGSYAVYLQRLNSSGVKQFASGGLLISNNPQSTSLVDYDMKTDASGNAVIAFTDTRNGSTINPFAYCISPSGSFLWGANGVSLSTTNTTYQANPKIAITSDGNYVIAWIYAPTVQKVAMQKLNSSGTKQWGNDPIYLTGAGSENFTYPDLVPSDNGSIIMMWSGYVGSFQNPTNYRLYSQKFSSAGAPVWNTAQDTVYGTGYVNGYYVPRIFPDGSNGAIYCWRDFRGNAANQTGYIQRTSSAGAFAFPVNGSPVSNLSSDNHFDPVAAYMPATGETVTFWYESNSNQSQYGVYGQKFSSSGSQLWGSSGIAFQPLWANQPANFSIYVKDTNAICYYNETSGGANNVIKAFRVGKSGGFVWSGNIVTASSVASPKIRLNASQNANGLSMLAWQDNRLDAGGIYAQDINFDGTFGTPTGITQIGGSVPAKFVLSQNYPNPFNPSTKIRFDVPSTPQLRFPPFVQRGESEAGGFVRLTIYDILGREIATLVNQQLQPGTYEVEWNAANNASGVYFYRLTAGNYSDTKRMVLMK